MARQEIQMVPVPSKIGDLSRDIAVRQHKNKILTLGVAGGLTAAVAFAASGVRAQEDPSAQTAVVIIPELCPPTFARITNAKYATRDRAYKW